MEPKQKFFIDQHGCAKNQVDGELIITLLKKKDWIQTFEPNEADLIIVNSCGFIESAKTESINAVMSARQMYPKAKILLAGCLAERYAAELKDDLTEADGFFGNGKLDEIYKILDPLMNNERPVLIPRQEGVCCGDRDILLSFPGMAFVKITEGCNNRCSFCAIPIIRGGLRSRKADEIVSEIKELVSKGVYEINLIGQDLAAYGTGAGDNCFGDGRTHLPDGTPGTEDFENCSTSGKSGLARLIEMISQIEGTFAVRLLYIHPDHFNEDILSVMQKDSRFLHYFDIPFQNGDDEIIKSMHRVGSQKKYKALISKIRSVFPDAAIRTTFMAGFPGESEKAFEATKKFLSEIATDWSGCFSYSKEDDTPAYSFKNQVPKKVAEKRASQLLELQAQITRERLKLRTGSEYDVLIEEVLSESSENPDEGLAIGRAWFQAPEVDGSVVIRYDRSSDSENAAVKTGRLVHVKITSSGDVDLNGDFLADSPLNAKIKHSDSIQFAQEL
ncbi:30S ribosomal protein S12 methylthiotransferase RimO [Treponema sp.]|uniref:30S ribosomal protein S12 methylthiotransferase RimO n=1 Tax=Treponema sp. TaxID=166 RepID=UPI0038908E07